MEKGQSCSFFSNKECEYFPCHSGIDEEDFNCLFCFCPLYALGDQCGGDFTYTFKGTKDCSGCLIPHSRDGYNYIISQCEKSTDMVKKQEGGNGCEKK